MLLLLQNKRGKRLGKQDQEYRSLSSAIGSKHLLSWWSNKDLDLQIEFTQ